MKKILIYGMTQNIGGMECFIMNYYRLLHGKFLHFDFLVNSQEMAFEKDVISKGSAVFHVTPRRQNFIKNLKELNIFFKTHAKRYDIIWSQQCDLTNIDILKFAYKYKIPRRIIHAHNSFDMHFMLIRPLTTLMHQIHQKKLYKWATDYWACSQKAGEFFYTQNYINSKKFQIIHNAIDTTSFRFNPAVRNLYKKKLNINNASLIIGFAGRLHEQKNPLFLLDIFANILKIYPKAILLIIGNGTMRSLMDKKVQKLGIQNAVHFLGIRQDLEKLMQVMDVFVLPSLYEGLPLVAIEAQAAGLPCVLSDTITKEVKITRTLSFCSISSPSHKWAEAIVQAASISRKDTYREIVEGGYDIGHQYHILYSLLS